MRITEYTFISLFLDTNLPAEKYQCKRQGCYFADYVKNQDYGVYYRNNSNCSLCQSKCSQDSNCGAVECGQTGRYAKCVWWKVGKCVDNFYAYDPHDPVGDEGYTCYKGKYYITIAIET